MDTFLRKVIERRDQETEERAKAEVVVGRKLCEVCYSPLAPGERKRGGSYDTEQRCGDCVSVVTWIPTPSPMESVPKDFKPREFTSICYRCGDGIPGRKARTQVVPPFCGKTECILARRSWMRQQAKSRKERERQVKEPIRIFHPPNNKPTSPGLIAQIEKMFGEDTNAKRSITFVQKEHDAAVDKLIAERAEAVQAERNRIANAAQGKLQPPPESQPIAKEASSEVKLTGEDMAAKTCPLDKNLLPEGGDVGFCGSHCYANTGRFKVPDYMSALRKGIKIPEKLRPRLLLQQRAELTAEGLEVPPDPAFGSNKDKRRATQKRVPKPLSTLDGQRLISAQPCGQAFKDIRNSLLERAKDYEKESARHKEEADRSEHEAKRFKEEAVRLRAAVKLLGQVKE